MIYFKQMLKAHGNIWRAMAFLLVSCSSGSHLLAESIINWGGDYVNLADYQRKNKSITTTYAGPLELGGGSAADYKRIANTPTEIFSPTIDAQYSGNSATYYGGLELITLNGVDNNSLSHEFIFGVREEPDPTDDRTYHRIRVKAVGDYRLSSLTYWKNDDSSKTYQLQNIDSVQLKFINAEGTARYFIIVDNASYISTTTHGWGTADLTFNNAQLLTLEWTPYSPTDNNTLYPENTSGGTTFTGTESFGGFGVLCSREALNAAINTKSDILVESLKVTGTPNPPMPGTLVRFE